MKTLPNHISRKRAIEVLGDSPQMRRLFLSMIAMSPSRQITTLNKDLTPRTEYLFYAPEIIELIKNEVDDTHPRCTNSLQDLIDLVNKIVENNHAV